MTCNLGSTTLRKRGRAADPMKTYDELPTPLRQWLANAVLPWSPKSCKRIWIKAQRRGQSPEDTITLLTAAESKALARDKYSTPRTD